MSHAIFGKHINNLFYIYHLKFKFNWVSCIVSCYPKKKKKKTGRQAKRRGTYESGYLKFVPLTFDSSDCRFTKKTSVYNLTSHEELATGKE